MACKMRANSSSSLLKTLVMENSASVTLLSTTQYCSVARKESASSVPTNTDPSVGEGLRCLNTLTVSHQGGQGRRPAERRNRTSMLPYFGLRTSEVCLNRSASESAR